MYTFSLLLTVFSHLFITNNNSAHSDFRVELRLDRSEVNTSNSVTHKQTNMPSHRHTQTRLWCYEAVSAG